MRRNVLLIATLLAAAAFLGWLAWVTPSESPAAHTAASPPAPQPAALVASGFAAAPAATAAQSPPAAQATVPVVGTAAAVVSAEVQEAVEQRQDAKITRGMSSNPQGGIRIDATPPGSVAEQMQLLPGDVLVAVNGAAISSPEQFARIYRSPGVQGEFVVIRDGREIHRR
ncbi:MAG TPA: PDZ domain-containing protein [Steroidobacteraceae bacterium]